MDNIEDNIYDLERLKFQDSLCHGDPDSTSLRSGIDVNKLREGSEVTFETKEIQDEELPEHLKSIPKYNYFDGIEALKYTNMDALGMDDGENGDNELSPFEKLKLKMKDITPPNRGLVFKSVTRDGSGDVVPNNAMVTLHYNAYLEYGDDPFDSTRLRNRVERFRIGEGMTWEGLEFAVSTMKKFEVSTFLLSPDVVAGKMGVAPRIPGNAWTLWEIELLNFSDREAVFDYYNLCKEEQEALTFSEVHGVVLSEKVLGNDFYKHKQYEKAEKQYNKALIILRRCRQTSDEEERMFNKEMATVLINLVLSLQQQKQWQRSLGLANQAINIDSAKKVKAYFLAGKALRMIREHEKARKQLLKAQRMKPNDKCINEELLKLEKDVAEYEKVEKILYGKMMNQGGAREENAERPNGKPAQKG